MSRPRGRPKKSETDLAPTPTQELAGMHKALRAEIKGLARYLLEDPLYLLDLQDRLRTRSCHPSIEALLMHYAYGKPKEQVEVKHAAVVKIIHEVVGAEVLDVEVQSKELTDGERTDHPDGVE